MKTDINNQQLLADSGLKIVHVRGRFPGDHDITVAYKPPLHEGHSFEIATAITHPKDTFTKKIGTKTAIENFQAGRAVRVPDNDSIGPVAVIRQMFI